jgi:type II secretory pathway pseudopilin PulG
MPNKHNKFTVGFTIIELLLALALTALLLTAVAFAFNASMTNYKENENIFKTINNARQALSRMTSQIRSGLVDPNDLSSNSCKLLCADGSDITYLYNSSNKKLYLRNNSTGVSHILCEDVSAMTFTKDNSTPTGDIKSVQISMTAGNGSAEQTFSAAAVVRKVLER